nr:transglutaminase-like cysteine peptidase [uncultured Gellertiella sp.]
MFKKILLAVAAIATITIGTISPANAFGLGSLSRKSTYNRDAGSAHLTPLAYQLFCLNNPRECRAGHGKSRVSYNSRIFATIAAVNRSVNSSIRPVHDRGDVWSLNPGAGDCEDYALTKRSRLIHAGIPSGALRIAVVRTRSGEGHAVLFVKTSAGDFVLDNLKSYVYKRQQMTYHVVAVSGANPLRWRNS